MSNQGDGGIASGDTNHFNTAKAGFKEGDYLYVEYGHNETNVDSYKSNLQKYYDACKAAKMKLIVVGPIDRCQTKQLDKKTGKWSSTLSGYSNAGKEFVDEKIASGATDIAFVDINGGWIEFLNNTSARVKEIRQSDTYDDNSVYYYYRLQAVTVQCLNLQF